MKIFQKVISLLLLLGLVFSLAACGKAPQDSTPTETVAPTQAAEATKPTEAEQPALPAAIEKVIVDTTGMTELQKAIVVTAESYYQRGAAAQYDQYALTNMASKNVNRRFLGHMAPEDYTSQYTGYTDCSSFVYDVYKFALGMSISSPANTKTYCAGSPHAILTETPTTSGFAEMTDEELSAKEKAFRDTLQPGDIIVYRKADGNSGHAMLYVGSNRMLHSSGSTYSYKNGTDNVEKNGTYRYDSIDILLDKNHDRYLFSKSIYVILRPLNSFEGTIPDHTIQRIGAMRGIIAEKRCSHTYGKTVTPGEELTYTFQVENPTSRDVTLAAADAVPAGTTYVSGAEKVNGDRLSWLLTVPAGESVSFSYTVRVNADTAPGTYIQSESDIGGIAVNCQQVMVGRTLTAEEQQAILDAQKELAGSGPKGIAPLNAIYEKACGKTVFTYQDAEALWNDLVLPFNGENFIMDPGKPLASLVVPRLYGGRKMGETDVFTQYRTRLVTKSVLVKGDVVLADNSLYLYTGSGLYNLSLGAKAGLYSQESLLRYDRFVVLRPSMAWE